MGGEAAAMLQGVTDLAPLSDLGGFDEKFTYTGTTNGIIGRCLMITEDKQISVLLGCGRKRTYPAGTFNTKTFYPIQTQMVLGGNTEVGLNAIFIGTDGPK